MDSREKLVKELADKKIFDSEGMVDPQTLINFILKDRERIEKEYSIIKEKAWKYDELCK